jgi:phosphomannomutase
VLRLDATAALPDSVQHASEGGTFLDRRLGTIGRHVVAEQAHFGLWIDGAGESCRLIDQQGRVVDGERWCRLLCEYVCRQQPHSVIAVEEGGTSELAEALKSHGASVIEGGATREAMFATLTSSGAVFGGGPCGTWWFNDPVPTADALLAISMLLVILSETDRPLSEVLDAA